MEQNIGVLKAIDGTICATEEVEQVNNAFWANDFLNKNNGLNIYLEKFKSYYYCYLENVNNPYEKWASMMRDYKHLLNKNLLNPNFARIIAGLLILYKPSIIILNEFFGHHESVTELHGIYQALLQDKLTLN